MKGDLRCYVRGAISQFGSAYILDATRIRFDRGFLGDKAGLVKTLRIKYANALCGWRHAFFDSVLHPIGFGQFCIGCKKAGYYSRYVSDKTFTL